MPRVQILSCHRSVAGAIALLAAGAACIAQQPTFRVLGCLPEGTTSGGNGVSGDGSVVVGSANSNVGVRGFRWQSTSPGGPVSIGLAPGWTGATAWAVSGDGATIVGSGGNFGGHGYPFSWTEAGGFEVLPMLPRGILAQALAVSHDGASAAGTCIIETPSGAFQRPVRWTSAGVQDLGTLPGGDVGEARGISGDGSVVTGYHSTATEYQAFRWTAAGGMTGLGMLPGELGSFGHAVSGDGSTIVGSSVYGVTPGQVYHPFRWTAATGMQPLPLPTGAVSAEATCVSHDGSVIAGYAAGPGAGAPGGGAVVWTGAGAQHVATLLGPALPWGFSLTRANGVSADGKTVVGIGTNVYGSKAWVVRLDGAPLPFVCYANCNMSCGPVLSIADFGCFQARYITQDPYADCNQDALFTIADFACFQSSFAAGCP